MNLYVVLFGWKTFIFRALIENELQRAPKSSDGGMGYTNKCKIPVFFLQPTPRSSFLYLSCPAFFGRREFLKVLKAKS